MYLNEILNRDKNNLDLLRVIAACMVIYGHAYAFYPQSTNLDFINILFAGERIHTLAVKIFFFISGLVVTNSLLQKRNAVEFAVNRIFRIWPALVSVLVLSAIVVGPILSTLPVQQYFADVGTYSYIVKGILLKNQHIVPGLSLPHNFQSINGSLWSIPIEVLFYFAVLMGFLIGVFRSKAIFVILFLLLFVDACLGSKVTAFLMRTNNPEVTMLPFCFALGMLSILFKERIKIGSLSGLLIAVASLLVFRISDLYVFLYGPLFYGLLWLSSRKVVLKLRPSVDCSYGIYLWGWPVQQLVQFAFPKQGIVFGQAVSIILSIILGCLSWYLVEKRFIDYGRNLSKVLSTKILKKKELAL